MTKFEQLEMMTKKGNGYFIIAEAVKSGISKQYISEFVKKKKMEKAAPGIYVQENVWVDELYIISLKTNVVFSHGKKYGGDRLRKRGYRVYTDTRDMFDVGKTTIETVHGNSVPVYDIDRTICDIIKIKDKLDIQVFRFAMKEYTRRKDKNLHHLMQYAKMMKMENKVRLYTEVML